MTSSPLSVVVGGASGFLGSHLVTELRARGHQVTRLVRRDSTGADESRWDPDSGEIDIDLIGHADVVVNLGGSKLVGNVHSKKWAHDIRASRLATTTTVVDAIAACATPPALLNASGLAWYGDHGDAPLTEASDTRGDTLLTELARDWEAATVPAAAAGARVVLLRTAPVYDRTSPPLKQQALQFRLGLGGRLGSGRQFHPLISLRDWVGGAVFLVEHPTAFGPVNLAAPSTPTNADYTRTLAALLHRPAFLPAPAPILKVAAGPMAPELLGSLNLGPGVLVDLGYEFEDPDVESVLRTGLGIS
ncbi:TIGR01777 family oxidoreductase [Nocardioides caeni]|uniref:TIGR01777 family protein n=1 Tax=Nocardioides caeni TaxID=574700 RepID=A0A4S8NGJ8_9ACTN|nr:TIGR01777 family oxidoreductase [Nocardioides caeni]THV15920.1 TIGR01777 family protein [Nocardioides caeni]